MFSFLKNPAVVKDILESSQWAFITTLIQSCALDCNEEELP